MYDSVNIHKLILHKHAIKNTQMAVSYHSHYIEINNFRATISLWGIYKKVGLKKTS